jgi:hypothetical protein
MSTDDKSKNVTTQTPLPPLDNKPDDKETILTATAAETPKNKSDDEEKIANEWSRLLQKFQITLETTTACGDRGDIHINAVRKEMEEFTKNHRAYSDDYLRLSKVKQYDDGVGGMSGAIANLAKGRNGHYSQNQYDMRDPCVVQ